MNDDVTIVNFIDRHIDSSSLIAMIGKDLRDLGEETGRKKIVLNLGNIEGSNDGILGAFILLKKNSCNGRPPRAVQHQ